MLESIVQNGKSVDIADLLEGYKSNIEQIITVLSKEGGTMRYDLDSMKSELKTKYQRMYGASSQYVVDNSIIEMKLNQNQNKDDSDVNTEILLVGEDWNDIKQEKSQNDKRKNANDNAKNEIDITKITDQDWEQRVWQQICELAYDFVIQPLPSNNDNTHVS